MVHDVARRGFGSEAEAYERSRPTYPPEALAWVLEQLRVAPAQVVVDLAAGTGKLTRLLAPAAPALVAIEPVAGMRAVLRQTVPGVPVLAGTAEALPLRTGSVDAVTVAQAFHWFDAPRALAELARVLRPGGRFAVVSNRRDRSLEWVAAVWAVMDEVESDAPWGSDTNWWDPAHLGPELALAGEADFLHEQATTPQGVVERIQGVSHVAALPPDQRDAVLARVRRVVGQHPDTAGRTELRIPYRTRCVVVERRQPVWRK